MIILLIFRMKISEITEIYTRLDFFIKNCCCQLAVVLGPPDKVQILEIEYQVTVFRILPEEGKIAFLDSGQVLTRD